MTPPESNQPVFLGFLPALLGAMACSGYDGAEPTPDVKMDLGTSQGRIVGGVAAPEYRELARLNADSGTFCSGTLIAPSYVLTAGHCLDARHGITVQLPYADADGEVRSVIGAVTDYRNGDDFLEPDIGILVLDSPVELDGGAYPYPLLIDAPLPEPTDVVVTGMKEGDTDTGSGVYRSPELDINIFDDNYYWHSDEVSRSGDSGGGVFVAGEESPRLLAGTVKGRSDRDDDSNRENFFARVDTARTFIDAVVTPPSCVEGIDELRIQYNRVDIHGVKEFLGYGEVQLKITVDGVSQGWSPRYSVRNKDQIPEGQLVGNPQTIADWGVTRNVPRSRCVDVTLEAREVDKKWGKWKTQNSVSHDVRYCYNATSDRWETTNTGLMDDSERKSDGKFDVTLAWRGMRKAACVSGSSPSTAMGAYQTYTAGDFNGDGIDEILAASGSWKTLFAFDPATNDYVRIWGNDGDSSHGITPYQKFVAGDFDGDGVDELLAHGSSWKTLFRFDTDNNDFKWSWSTYGDSHGMSPYQDFVAGDFDGDGADELLAYGSSWKTRFRYDAEDNDFKWSWSTYGDSHGMSPYQKFVAGDFDGDETDEILAFGSSWKTLFRFDTEEGDFNWSWSTYGDSHSLSPYQQLITGNFDGVEGDEVLGFGSSWKTLFRYSTADNDFDWSWSTYGDSHGLSPYEKLVAGRFRNPTAAGLLAHGGWTTEFYFQANDFHWGWSDYGGTQ